MINDNMKKAFMTKGQYMPFTWYVWNATMFRDDNAMKGNNPQWTQRNQGLVFQDSQFDSDIRPW
jgi:hypothetical protein